MDLSRLSSREIIGMIDNGIEMSKDKGWPYLIGLETNSDQEKETYTILGATPAMREWLGSRSAKSLRTAGIDVINKHFEATITIAVRDLRRDKTKFIQMRISQLVNRGTQHWASLLSTLIEAGGSTVCIDGQLFYSASHSWGKSGTWSNLLTKTDYPALQVSNTSNVTPDEMAKAILAVVSHFYSIKDDQGEPANEDANRFMIQVPVALMAATVQACASKFLSTGTGVRDNPLVNEDIQISCVPAVNPRFTSSVVFYVHRIDGLAKAFILQNETAPKTSAKAEGSEFEHDNDAHEYGIDVWRNAGYGFPDKSIKATLSTQS